MQQQAKSIRPFIGAKDFIISKTFYNDLGFEESIISRNMSYFKIFDTIGFYLQDAYVKDWVNNSMIFVEVENIEAYYNELHNLHLQNKYKGVRLLNIKKEEWGSEFFLHDPSGILWHFGSFK
jgi:ribonucleotide reductase beta subunit family protein with ferritin-like domain